MKQSTALIPLPSASATKTALLINEHATDADLAALGHTLAQVEGSRSWWLGDYGLELQRRKAKEAKASNPNAQDDENDATGLHYMGQRADALGIDEGNWRNCVLVARYFKPSLRTDISFGHHYIAMLAAGGAKSDPRKALEWLDKTKTNAWSISQLRHKVNLHLATSKQPELKAPANPFAPLDEADRWAIHQQGEDYTPEAAANCLTRFRALIAFIKRLETIAGSRPM